MPYDIPTEVESYDALAERLMIPTVLKRETIYYEVDPEMEERTLLFRRDAREPAAFVMRPAYVSAFREAMLQPWQQLLSLDEWRRLRASVQKGNP